MSGNKKVEEPPESARPTSPRSRSSINRTNSGGNIQINASRGTENISSGQTSATPSFNTRDILSNTRPSTSRQFPSETERTKSKQTTKHFTNGGERHKERLVSRNGIVDSGDTEQQWSPREEETRWCDTEEESQGAVGGVTHTRAQILNQNRIEQDKYVANNNRTDMDLFGNQLKYSIEESDSNNKHLKQGLRNPGNDFYNYPTGHNMQISNYQLRGHRSPPLSRQGSSDYQYGNASGAQGGYGFSSQNMPLGEQRHKDGRGSPPSPSHIDNYLTGTIIQMGRRAQRGLDHFGGLTEGHLENRRKSPVFDTRGQAICSNDFPNNLPKPNVYDPPRPYSTDEHTGIPVNSTNYRPNAVLNESTDQSEIRVNDCDREFYRRLPEYRNIFMSLVSDGMNGRIRHIAQRIPTDPPLELHDQAPTRRSGDASESSDVFESVVQDMIEEGRIYLRQQSERMGIPFDEKVLDTVINLFNTLLRQFHRELTRRQC